MAYIRTDSGKFIPVCFSTSLYNLASSTGYDVYINQHQYATRELAEAAAPAAAGVLAQQKALFGIPSPIAYISGNIRNAYGVCGGVRETAAGTYAETVNGKAVASVLAQTDSFYTLTDPYNGIYGFSGGYEESDQEPNAYGFDTATCQILPESVITDGKIQVPDNTVIRFATVLCRAGFVYSGYYEDYRLAFAINATKDSSYDISTWLSQFDGAEIVYNIDPMDQGGVSDTDPPDGSPFTGAGGMGVFSIPDAAVGIPALPSLSAVDTGLVRLYCDSSAGGMQALASYLWSGAFDPATFKKLFSDPMQLIIGASIMPCTPSTTNATIIFGNIDTEVSMPRAATQYVAVSCGTIQVREQWGAYLDYSPFTKASIYLPYIGTREIDIDEIMGKTVGVEYHVDIMSGACVAFITANSRVIAQYSGSCGMQIPVTSQNWGQVLQSLAQIGGAAISGFVSGGAGGALMSAGLSAASNAIAGGLKPQYQHSGTVSGAAGILAGQRPYIIFNIPNQSKPLNYPKFEGYPSNATMLLGSCNGYTRVEEINLEGIRCTQPELDEIEALLKEGVLF